MRDPRSPDVPCPPWSGPIEVAPRNELRAAMRAIEVAGMRAQVGIPRQTPEGRWVVDITSIGPSEYRPRKLA